MLHAFARYNDGSSERQDSVWGIVEVWSKQPTAVWIDLEGTPEADLRAIGRIFDLDADALEDCLYGEQRPRIDEFEDHIFLVVYGLLAGPGQAAPEPRKLAVFCGARFLITVHREPLATITAARERCVRHSSAVLARGIDFLLYNILDAMVDNYTLLSERYETRLDELEEESLAPEVDASILPRLTALRREILELRAIAESQRDLLQPVVRGEYDFVSEGLEARFAHVRDHLTHVVELIDRLRDVANNIRDNYHSALTARANMMMKTLTVFASLLLPLSVVAGIYGMNVPLWPPGDHPLSFWAVLGVMLGITSALLLYFRRQRWI